MGGSQATYWEAAVCSVCGETVGDVLTPAFEELGVKGQFMEGLFGGVDSIEVDGEMVEVTEENLMRLYSELFGLTGDFENLTEVLLTALEKNDGIDLDARTTARATVTDYQVFDSDETHDAKEGYEWKTVEMQIEYDTPDEGWRVSCGYNNYYEKYEQDAQEDSEYEPGWDNEATHTVNWKGQDYTECRAIMTDENTLFFRLQ